MLLFKRTPRLDLKHGGQMNPQEKNQTGQERARVFPIDRSDRSKEISPEGLLNDQDPGMTQKQNQNDDKDDPLAA